MDGDHCAIPSLQATLDCAIHFGLTEDEVWGTVKDVLYGVESGGTEPDYLDEVAGALAQAILSKQQRILRRRLL